MQIIGFNFNKIHIERKKNLEGKLHINSNVNIKEISQDKIDLIKEQSPLKFDFEFKVTYNPDIAEIIFTGTILGLLDKDKAKDVLKQWKSKKIAEEVRLQLFNFLLTKCSIKALQLEEEFGLPTHLPLPQMKPKEDQNNNRNYAG